MKRSSRLLSNPFSRRSNTNGGGLLPARSGSGGIGRKGTTPQGAVFGLIFFIVLMVFSILAALVYSSFPSVPAPSSSTTTLSTTKIATAHKNPGAAKDAVGAIKAIQAVRQEFYERYGGKERAQAMYRRGVKPYGDIHATAARVLRAAVAQTPLVLSFAGYSVTVGRGNFYKQSYPFVLEHILKPVLSATFQLDLLVRNAAIGGIPSFPYGFCLEHFLGHPSPHVISWDYSMNEGKGAAVLESYIRHSQHQLSETRPMLIMLDVNEKRCQTLQQYTKTKLPANGPNAGPLIEDGMCVGMAENILDDDLKALISMPDDSPDKPSGFKQWSEFGAPAKCPGRGNWHPKFKEHELIGWIMAMYFVDAIEIAIQTVTGDRDWREHYKPQDGAAKSPLYFPAPFQPSPSDEPEVTALMYGHEVTVADGTKLLQMKPVSCRTNFLPATDNDNVLTSIVVSGLAPDVSAENIIQERSDAAYQAGWVLDVSTVERSTKVKVEQCGGLGYVDMKIALYGIPESGTLRLWLPVSSHVAAQHDAHAHNDNDDNAQHWFDNFVVCEANEKRPDAACQLDADLEYTVGGVVVPTAKMISGAGEYLKRKTCVHVGVPTNAKITRFLALTNVDGTPLSQETRIRLSSSGIQAGGAAAAAEKAASRLLAEDHVGLVIDIRAKSRVRRDAGACCLSHVVWEEH